MSRWRQGAYSAPAAPPGASACRSRASPPSSSTSRYAPPRARALPWRCGARAFQPRRSDFSLSGSRPGSGFTRGVDCTSGEGGPWAIPLLQPLAGSRRNSLLPRGKPKGGFLWEGRAVLWLPRMEWGGLWACELPRDLRRGAAGRWPVSPQSPPALPALRTAGRAREARAPLRPRTLRDQPWRRRCPPAETFLSLLSFAFALGGPRARSPPLEPQPRVVSFSEFVLGVGWGGELVTAGDCAAPVRSPRASRCRQRVAGGPRGEMATDKGLGDVKFGCSERTPGASISSNRRRFCRLRGRGARVRV